MNEDQMVSGTVLNIYNSDKLSIGSRILFTHIEPEREVHGMVLKHVGNGKEYKLYASTPSERDTWKFKVRKINDHYDTSHIVYRLAKLLLSEELSLRPTS